MALIVLGAGLIHLAIAAGSPLGAAIGMAALGVAELGWGLIVLARGTVVFPTAALLGSLAPVVLWGLLATARVAGGESALTDFLPLGPLTAASLLNLAVALILAVDRRPRRTRTHAESSARPGRYLLGMVLGAMAVAGIVTPALAATNAGMYAVPHGEHGTPSPGDNLKLPAGGTHSGH
jgi:hypothetical protein